MRFTNEQYHRMYQATMGYRLSEKFQLESENANADGSENAAVLTVYNVTYHIAPDGSYVMHNHDGHKIGRGGPLGRDF